MKYDKDYKRAMYYYKKRKLAYMDDFRITKDYNRYENKPKSTLFQVFRLKLKAFVQWIKNGFKRL